MAHQNQIRSLTVAVVAAALLSILGTPAAEGAEYTWDNGSGDGLWATAANWSPDAAPGSSDAARLDGRTTPGAVDLGGVARVVNSLTIENGTGSYTLQGGTLSLGSGLLLQTDRVTGANSINATVSGDALDFAVGGGILNVGGTIKGTTLAKDGPGTLSLTNAVSLTGATTVNGGRLVLSGSGRFLGTTGVTVSMAGLTFDNAATSLANRFPDAAPIVLQGGTLRLSSGTNSEQVGNLTISGPGLSMVVVEAGILYLGSTFTASTIGGIVNFSGGSVSSQAGTSAGIMSQRAVINGADFIGKSGNVFVPYTGYAALPVSGGSTSSNFLLTGNKTLTGTVALNTLKIAPATGSQTLNLSETGFSGNPSILFTGSNDFTINGNFAGNSNVTILNFASQPLVLANSVGASGSGTLTVGGTGTTIKRSGGASSSNTAYIIAGGTLKLGTPLADGKPWTIAGGTLDMSDTAASGTAMTFSALTLNAGTITSSLGSPHQTLAGDITAGSGSSAITGVSVSLDAPRTVTVTGRQDMLTISAAIDGAAKSLTKSGLGTLILSGSNSYSGPTNILNGTLEANATGALPADSSITVDSATLVAGATQHVAGLSLTNGAKASISAVGTGAGSRTIKTHALSIDATSLLDLRDNNLIVNYSNDNTGNQLQAVINLIKSGGGTKTDGAHFDWNGTSGITSSSVALTGTAAIYIGLGVRDYGFNLANQQVQPEIEGVTVESGTAAGNAASIVVKYTWVGDMDLDGKVTVNDYLNWLNYYRFKPDANYISWMTGDFNYDGLINVNDYLALLNAYRFQGAQLGSGEAITGDVWQEDYDLVNATPEPATTLMLALGGTMAALARKRRR
jgi:fibronectin-binding autotransporter adhesin